MSPGKWPWRRLGMLLAAIVVIAISGLVGWFLAPRSSSSSPPTTTEKFPDQTVRITIPGNVLNQGPGQTPDNADKVPPDPPSVVSVVIPGAALEKLAPSHELWLHEPRPAWATTWGPPISALLVSFVALRGVMWAADRAAKSASEAADKAAATALLTSARERESDARSEWFRRFKDMLDLALDEDGTRSAAGSTMLALHVKSHLAGDEEKELAATVVTDIVEKKRALAAQTLRDAAQAGDKVRFVVGDNPPAEGS